MKKGSLIKKIFLRKISKATQICWYFGQILSNFLEIFSIFFKLEHFGTFQGYDPRNVKKI